MDTNSAKLTGPTLAPNWITTLTGPDKDGWYSWKIIDNHTGQLHPSTRVETSGAERTRRKAQRTGERNSRRLAAALERFAIPREEPDAE